MHQFYTPTTHFRFNSIAEKPETLPMREREGLRQAMNLQRSNVIVNVFSIVKQKGQSNDFAKTDNPI
jgi:hypothetical protein